MLIEGNEGDTSELTPSEAASLFEESFPGDTADTEDASATPPTHESPESESDDPEAESEQAEGEDESTETDDEEGDEPEAQPAEELFTVTVDGKPVQVTRDELVKSYSRQADYTRKTQELAEQRKAHEAETLAVREERKQRADSLAQLQEAIKSVTPKEPDWNTLRATLSPGEYAAEYAAWSQHKDEMRAIAEERKKAEEAVQADQAKAFAEHLKEQTRLLAEALPEMKDPEKAKALRADLAAAAESVGFTANDLNSVTDHRLMLLLAKAAKYDKAQKARPVLQQKIDEKVKASKPGPAGALTPKPKSKAASALKRLAQTGSVRDAAAFFETV